jgi:hypothetical protein
MVLALSVAAALTGSAQAAPAARAASGGTLVQPSIVSDHVAQTSGPVTTLTGPNDRMVTAWAYRILRGIGVIYVPLVGPVNEFDGIQDGPDGYDPIGVKSPTKLPAVSSSGGGG